MRHLFTQYRLVFALLACTAFGSRLFSAEDSAQNAQMPANTPSQAQASRQSATRDLWFSLGYDQRFRHENWTDIQDQNSLTMDDKVWSIFRQRFWMSIPLGTRDLELYVRLLNQFAKTSTPSTPLNLDEVIFDNLYFHLKKTFIPGMSIKAGRQDIMFGEGFILMDGSAVDGPRTAYVNAVDIQFKHRRSKFDLIGMLNPRQEKFLPVIHKQPRYLNESDEQAVGAYYQDRNFKNTDFDLYYFLKKEIHDYRAPANPAFQPDRHVNTIGGRIVHIFGRGVSATGEFALQRGAQHTNTTIHGWGGYGYLKKSFEARLSPYVLGSYWALSGDNPSTSNRYEGWDPLWERWPKWSGLYPWSLVPEKGISYWTNLKMVQAEAGFTPWKPLTIKGIVYINDSFHPYAPGNPKIFAGDTRRGVLPGVLATYAFGHSVVGEFRYEVLHPGDFYTNHSTGQFFRFELNYSWKHPVER
jgi:hypothetical protein